MCIRAFHNLYMFIFLDLNLVGFRIAVHVSYDKQSTAQYCVVQYCIVDPFTELHCLVLH